MSQVDGVLVSPPSQKREAKGRKWKENKGGIRRPKSKEENMLPSISEFGIPGFAVAEGTGRKSFELFKAGRTCMHAQTERFVGWYTNPTIYAKYKYTHMIHMSSDSSE